MSSTSEIVGRYELANELAAGGMATVHLARLVGSASGFSKVVAIKRLHPHYAKDPEFVQSLLDEGRLTARIRHTNVVSVLDVEATGSELFLVMEYVQGETLAKLLKRSVETKTTCDPSVAAAILHGVLLGLHAAHETADADGTPLGIIHRDVSPQNVIVGADGVARVLDFGIAKAVGRASNTAEGEFKGKIGYMAPEQLLARETTRRADVYACGVVLWEVLCKRRLFAGESSAAVYTKVIAGKIPPPSEIAPGARALDAVVARATARDAADRFATALDMARALENALHLASADEVSAWVSSLARDALEARQVLVRDLEKRPPIAAGAAAAQPPGPARRARWPWAVALALLAAAPLAFATGRLRASAVPAPVASVAPQVQSAAPREPADLVPPDLDPPSTPPKPPTVGTPSASAAKPSTPRRPPTAPPINAGAKPPAPDCDPPYTIEAGRKRFKLQCIQ